MPDLNGNPYWCVWVIQNITNCHNCLFVHRKDKRNNYSRRRKYHADKDVDFINDRNAHFNKKIDRAFGQYTQETKANLERGTALPDH